MYLRTNLLSTLEKVKSFAQPQTELMKETLAREIANDRRGYQRFIKELSLDWKEINNADRQLNKSPAQKLENILEHHNWQVLEKKKAKIGNRIYIMR